jgi:hypothetical protein
MLRARPEVDEVSHYGPMLRVATRGEDDPEALIADVLSRHGIAAQRLRSTRVTVEDAFVSMVRHEGNGVRKGSS